jgi:hypothetical protein
VWSFLHAGNVGIRWHAWQCRAHVHNIHAHPQLDAMDCLQTSVGRNSLVRSTSSQLTCPRVTRTPSLHVGWSGCKLQAAVAVLATPHTSAAHQQHPTERRSSTAPWTLCDFPCAQMQPRQRSALRRAATRTVARCGSLKLAPLRRWAAGLAPWEVAVRVMGGRASRPNQRHPTPHLRHHLLHQHHPALLST